MSARKNTGLEAGNRFIRAAIAASALVALGAGTGMVSAQEAEAYAAGRILMMPRAGLPDAALARILKENGGGTARRVGKSELRIVDLPRGQEKRLVERLARHPHVKFAELDYRAAPVLVTNDPYLGSAWHLTKIGADVAWDVTRGAGVTLAVLDSGVDGTHPDLAGRLVPGWNFYDNNSNTSDVYGHGTLVAGSAAATLNNGVGVASVSGDAAIMPIRVTDTSGAGWTSMIANGLVYAADRGVRVANISFANMPSRSSVVSAAQYMKDKGGLVFVAAGNAGIDEGYAVTTSLIPVSATDSSDAKAGWSSFGNFVALSAPGVGIYTTSRGGGYTSSSGTSIATPVAAGVAALAFAARPGLTSQQAESVIFGSVVDLGTTGRDAIFGHGRVDAGRAVAAALAFNAPSDTQPPSVAIRAPLGSATVSGLTPVDVTAIDNVGVKRVELRANGSLVAADTAAPFAFSWDTVAVPNGGATLVATAYDAAGNASASAAVAVNVANVSVVDTTAPVVAIGSPGEGATVTGTVTIQVNASDNGGSTGLLQKLLIDGRQVASATGGKLSYKWSTRKVPAGSHTITAVATDAAGNTSTKSISVQR